MKPIAHLLYTSIGARIVIGGIEIPSYPVGNMHDKDKEALVKKINAAIERTIYEHNIAVCKTCGGNLYVKPE